jgi:hypothetical protein
VFQEADQPVVVDAAKEVPNIGVKYVVHPPTGDCYRQGVQRIMRPSSRSKCAFRGIVSTDFTAS